MFLHDLKDRNDILQIKPRKSTHLEIHKLFLDKLNLSLLEDKIIEREQQITHLD